MMKMRRSAPAVRKIPAGPVFVALILAACLFASCKRQQQAPAGGVFAPPAGAAGQGGGAAWAAPPANAPPELADALSLGVWPLPPNTYDPTLDTQGIPGGVSVYGLFGMGSFTAIPAPERLTGYRKISDLSAMAQGDWYLLSNINGFNYAIVAQGPVTAGGASPAGGDQAAPAWGPPAGGGMAGGPPGGGAPGGGPPGGGGPPMGGFGGFGGPGGFEMPAFAVHTTPAVRGQVRDYLALTGDIAAGSTVDVYSDTAGKVTRVYVSLGQRVTRSQAVVEVDPSRPGTTYMTSVVRAPVAGTVVALPAVTGMTVSQQIPVARVAAGSALELHVYVAERFISKMAVNLPCEITLDAWPGEVFQGSITELSPVVDPASRTMEVTINVSNTGGRLRAGMFAKVKIFTDIRQNAVKIPAGALIERFGQSFVFVAEADPASPGTFVARQRIVTPGIKVDNVLEIRQGLNPDEDVLIRGHTQLFEGSKINIVERIPPMSAN